MKVLVLGASGIIAQHMRLTEPDSLDPGEVTYLSEHASPISTQAIIRPYNVFSILSRYNPDVVVNLAGIADVEYVEQEPAEAAVLNVVLPSYIASWCHHQRKRMIQVSSQAALDPVNTYGKQKLVAENVVLSQDGEVARLTFVLGIRPCKLSGRSNPMEGLLEQVRLGDLRPQVANRFFSPLWAQDAAAGLWDQVLNPRSRVTYYGEPVSVTRHDVAYRITDQKFPEITQEELEREFRIARRPKDTTFPKGSLFFNRFTNAIAQKVQAAAVGLGQRTAELALFFRLSQAWVESEMAAGFGEFHRRIGEEFKSQKLTNTSAILEWYRRTEGYIWELSAYHEDPGFNYMGMCRGIVERLKAEAAGYPDSYRVLVLGDGVGDVSLEAAKAGMEVYYHDLEGSRTAEFARFRFWCQGAVVHEYLSDGWALPGHLDETFDAVVSLDFLEHVPNVPEWVESVYRALKPGGLFCAQNAFNCGSGPEGSIPMHLKENDRFEHDWDPLLGGLGFQQLSSNWYQRGVSA